MIGCDGFVYLTNWGKLKIIILLEFGKFIGENTRTSQEILFHKLLGSL